MRFLRSFWLRLTRPAVGRALVVLIAALCLTLTAVHPTLFRSLPVSSEGPLHLYRLVAFDHAIRHGDWWPRYLPGLLYGYGSPLFNYTSPLPFYLFEGLHLLGLRFVDALLTGLIVCVFLGTLGAYQLGSVWGEPAAGLGTAAAYTYAPYLLYESLRHGDLAQYAALALLPWVLWAFFRLSRRGRRLDFVWAVVLYSLFVLTHNVPALYGTVLLVLWAVFLWWTSPDPRRAFVRLFLAVGLGIGLAAFYWAPALGEMSYIHIGSVAGYQPVLDFRENFLTLGQIFELPATVDLLQLHPPVPRALGWPQTALAVLGLVLIVWPGHDQEEPSARRGWLVLLSILVIGSIFLITPASEWVWSLAPLMRFIQHPWRLLGPASLCLAMLAGQGVALIVRRIPWPVGRMIGTMVCLAVLIGYGLPWLYGVYMPDPPARTVLDVLNFERQTNQLAGTGVIVPRWTVNLPKADRLVGLYAQGEVIPRLQPNPDVRLDGAAWGASRASLAFTARADTTLVFDWLYFPGWWALLDGEWVEIAPVPPHGFVGLDVSQGSHELALGFGPTPLRSIAGYVSLGALASAAVALMALRIWRRGSQTVSDREDPAHWPEAGAAFVAAVLVGLMAFGGKALLIDNTDTFIKRSRFAHGLEAGLQMPVQASFGGQVTLLGYDLPRAQVRSGRTFSITLYWTQTSSVAIEDCSSVVLLRDPAGYVVQQVISHHPAGVPTSQWAPGFYVREPIQVAVPPGTPPGAYAIQVEMIPHATGRSLEAFDVQGRSQGMLLNLATIEVTRPRRPASLSRLEIGAAFNAHLSDAIALVGATLPPAQAGVGEPVPMVWYWRATSSPEADYQARLLWLSNDGEIAARSPLVPPVTGYPTSQWAKRDVWRGLHMLYVPGRLEPGEYEVAVELVSPSGSPAGEPVAIGKMRVNAPLRTFDVPSMAFDAGVGWQNGIQLLGYDLPEQMVRQGDGLGLVLYWQPQVEVTRNLTVLIQLIDPGGRVVTQYEQIPAGGKRPTTSWAPGEVVADVQRLFVGTSVSPGRHRLRIGWYEASTGEQIALADGSQWWLLPQAITVGGAP